MKIKINEKSGSNENKLKLNLGSIKKDTSIHDNNLEFGEISDEYRDTLYKIDRSMASYRENKEKPGTKEYKQAQAAEEIFSKPFHF